MGKKELDLSKPIEIAEDIFWVGYSIPNDPFQCHVYLIRNGNESILIDPGSIITFAPVVEKIFQVLPSLKDIKYIIFHHQDPDITGSYRNFEAVMPEREDRYIVTHWRAEALLKHYAWKTPFYLVDKHDWKLKAGDRELEFVFTPYAHFPGAFCTFDKKTKTLFSSDIFGGISEYFNLFADLNNKEYMEGVKLFHKHYMPSKGILDHALQQIEAKEPELIAPQHGSIIPKELIKPIIKELREIDCGLYLIDDKEGNIFILDKIDEIIKRLFERAVISSDFHSMILNLFKDLNEEIAPIEDIVIISPIEKGKSYFLIKAKNDKLEKKIVNYVPEVPSYSLKYDLIDEDNHTIGTLYIVSALMNKTDRQFMDVLLRKIGSPLGMSLKRDILLETLEEENQKLYEESTRDQLTGLFNRGYFNKCIKAKIKEAKEHKFPLSLCMIDIDHFKNVNDTYGHTTGDCILKELASLILKQIRSTDCAARYGGEEFVIILPSADQNSACKKMDSIRKIIENNVFCKKQGLNLKITISAGVGELKESDSVLDLINNADKKLYIAKNAGRNRVGCE